MLGKYYRLTKPGIIRGNILTAAAGFVAASNGHIEVSRLFWTLAGISLVIASGCVFNNVLDRRIDQKMNRTKKRALALGIISIPNAIAYASALGLVGFLILALKTNTLTVAIGLVGIFSYVVLYGYAKRKGSYGTEVGTISGATPILAGYTAVTNHIDGLAILLFVLMMIWQMAHFYAIAIFRLKDYKNAGVPVLSAVKGVEFTKRRILVYIGAYGVVALLGAVFSLSSWAFSLSMAALGLYWLHTSIKGFHTLSAHKWARKSFGVSLMTLLIFSCLVALQGFLN